jgi:hypothetical protein
MRSELRADRGQTLVHDQHPHAGALGRRLGLVAAPGSSPLGSLRLRTWARSARALVRPAARRLARRLPPPRHEAERHGDVRARRGERGCRSLRLNTRATSTPRRHVGHLAHRASFRRSATSGSSRLDAGHVGREASRPAPGWPARTGPLAPGRGATEKLPRHDRRPALPREGAEARSVNQMPRLPGTWSPPPTGVSTVTLVLMTSRRSPGIFSRHRTRPRDSGLGLGRW